MVSVRCTDVTPPSPPQIEKAQRRPPPIYRPPAPPLEIVRQATYVERLAYTRTQAAAALGISRSTFDRRVLPLVETVKMPWGAHLIPVDELKRLITERRMQPRHARPAASPGAGPRSHPASSSGSGPSTPPASLSQIARELNAERDRLRTVARNGGPRPCAPSFADPRLTEASARLRRPVGVRPIHSSTINRRRRREPSWPGRFSSISRLAWRMRNRCSSRSWLRLLRSTRARGRDLGDQERGASWAAR